MVVNGANSMSAQYPFLPQNGKYNLRFHLTDDRGISYANTKFTIILPDYQVFQSVTDAQGFTPTFYSNKKGIAEIKLHLGVEEQ